MSNTNPKHLIIDAIDHLAEIKRYQALLKVEHSNRDLETLELLVESFLILTQPNLEELESALKRCREQLS